MQLLRLMALLVVPVAGSQWSVKGLWPSKAEKKNILQGGGRRAAELAAAKDGARNAVLQDGAQDAVVLAQKEASVIVKGQYAEAKPAGRTDAVGRPSARRNRQQMREHSLIKSLKHVGDSFGSSGAMGCVTTCRYGEVRHSWRECLDRCVDNGLLRATLMTMLPAEQHDPLHPDLEMPDELKVAAKKRLLLNKMRSAEL
mmetsp:Transcript_67636/g.180990  ORF Transcript_67636/g.180990 Transcript_67636/m.180990 type:complete len:199 (-) Transcript_67636:247-843(-)